MKCPICNSHLIEEIVNRKTDVSHGVFECGTVIIYGIVGSEILYDYRCDQDVNIDVDFHLTNPRKMCVSYAQKELPSVSRHNIFLAGPTPRDNKTKSWRTKALKIIKKRDYKGWVFVPETKGGFTDDFEYSEQIEWEESALKKADVIVFWIPRELEKMPAFTTNIEWGFWACKNPKKLVLGYPENTPKMDYIKYYADKLGIKSFHTLEETITEAIKMIDNKTR